MTNTINLPVNTIKNIINIDDKNVLVPIENIIQSLAENSDKPIRSMYTIFNIIDNNNIEFNHDISYITKCVKLPITNTNDIHYYELNVKFYNDKEVKLVIPGYVKLFSKTAKTFVPVEFIKKIDILIDYQGYNVHVLSNTPLEDFKCDEYYNIQLNSNNDDFTSFYFDGILGYVYYNNFQKDSEEINDLE